MYERPQSLFVAQFLGESNVLDGRVDSHHDGMAQIELAGGAARIVAPSSAVSEHGYRQDHGTPESLALMAAATPGMNSLAWIHCGDRVPWRVDSL
jgi:ABC-type Fe3+/spermidine/putrescine transport system ATPase subunit